MTRRPNRIEVNLVTTPSARIAPNLKCLLELLLAQQRRVVRAGRFIYAYLSLGGLGLSNNSNGSDHHSISTNMEAVPRCGSRWNLVVSKRCSCFCRLFTFRCATCRFELCWHRLCRGKSAQHPKASCTPSCKRQQQYFTCTFSGHK